MPHLVAFHLGLHCLQMYIRPPDKSVYLNFFFISHPKHMLKLMGKKISKILRK